MRTLLLTTLVLFLNTCIYAEESLYDLLLKGKKCGENSYIQQIDCDYKIGKDLWISIAGIGYPDASVNFMKSDFNGKYYGSYGLSHGCVIVKSADLMNIAFISPKNGTIYKDWLSCENGNEMLPYLKPSTESPKE